MNNSDRCFCELTSLYVLDLLDEADRAWVEAQAAASEELAAELAELQATVGALPYCAPVVPMAADLKDRLFQRLDLEVPAEPAVAPGLDNSAVSPIKNVETAAGQRSVPIWIWVGGVIAILALSLLGLDNYRLRQAAQETDTIFAALQQPNTSIYTLQGTDKAAQATGHLVVDPQRNAVMIFAHNLPSLPTAEIYRLWAIPKGASQPIYCGQFKSQSQATTARWTAPDQSCRQSVAQMLITTETIADPFVPAGALVMKSL
jgi:hypothetical protein